MVNKLVYPPEWKEVWTKYPHGLTIFEAVVDWVNKVNDLVDLTNTTQENVLSFYETIVAEIATLYTNVLPASVETVLDEWYASGKLADLINLEILGGIETQLASTIKQLSDSIQQVKFYGAVGDSVTDDTLAIQLAFDSNIGKTVFIPKGTYKITSQLNIKGNVISDGAILKFYGTTIDKLVEQTIEADLIGFSIDGSNVTNCQYGLFVNTDFVQSKTCKYALKITNITNNDNTKGANGAVFYKSSAASVNLKSKLDIKIDVENVTATGNAINGDNGGSSTGVFISFNGVGTDSHIYVHDCIVKGIHPAEDSCGIQTYQGDYAVSTAKGKYIIERCEVSNAEKRSFKIQTPNTKLVDCTSNGETTITGFDTYGYNTVFENCRHLKGLATGFQVNKPNVKLLNCFAECLGNSPIVRLMIDSHSAIIDDLEIVATATFPSQEYGILTVEGINKSLLNNVRIKGVTNTGSAIIFSNNNDVVMKNINSEGFAISLYFAYSIGKITIIDSFLKSLTHGVIRTGNTLQKLIINNSEIEAGSIGIYCSGTGISALVEITNSKVSANANGLLLPDGSRVVDCAIISTGVSGIGLQLGNSVARGNRITKYAVGISYTYTTTAEVSNNVTIGTTLPYETTSFTPFINHDNYSR